MIKERNDLFQTGGSMASGSFRLRCHRVFLLSNPSNDSLEVKETNTSCLPKRKTETERNVEELSS